MNKISESRFVSSRYDDEEVGIEHSACFECNLIICDPESGFTQCVECSCKDDTRGIHDENDEDTCRICRLGECI